MQSNSSASFVFVQKHLKTSSFPFKNYVASASALMEHRLRRSVRGQQLHQQKRLFFLLYACHLQMQFNFTFCFR